MRSANDIYSGQSHWLYGVLTMTFFIKMSKTIVIYVDQNIDNNINTMFYIMVSIFDNIIIIVLPD